jgi:tricorn protease-like protein
MRRACSGLAALILVFVPFAQGAPAPIRPVINVANANSVEKAGEVPYDCWQMVLGPQEGQVSLIAWEAAIDVYDDYTSKCLRHIVQNRKLVHMAYSPDGTRLAYCENSTKAGLLDLRSGKLIEISAGGYQPDLAFSPDGKLLATGGTKAMLWDATTGVRLRTFDSDLAGALTVRFSPNGKTLAIGNRNSTTRLFDTTSGRLLHVLKKQSSQELKFSPDGKLLAVAYVDGSVALWNAADGTLARSKKTSGSELYSLDWSPAGDVLVTSGSESKITLWNPADLSILKELESPPWVIQVRFNHDGTRLFTAGGSLMKSPDRKVTVWAPTRR